MQEKVCHSCGYRGPRGDFHEPDHRNLCKPCRRMSKKLHRRAAVERPKQIVITKTCTTCDVSGPVGSLFGCRSESPDGYENRCISCVNQVRRAYWLANRRKLNDYQRDLKYGLVTGQYDSMLQTQNGRCAICHNPPSAGKVLVVDHDHATGNVRSLLCSQCNFGLGYFADNEENLLGAIAYLRNHCG